MKFKMFAHEYTFLYSTQQFPVIFTKYYFGDHNLPRDKFLKEQLQLDDGWVTLETMLKFNRCDF